MTLSNTSHAALLRRIAHAGFKRDFVRSALLPEWWSDECSMDRALIPEMEFRVARFLGMSLDDVRSPDVELRAPSYPGAKLRRIQGGNRDRLDPAIHAALRIAGAVARSLMDARRPVKIPPEDGADWRDAIERDQDAVFLGDALRDLWRRGIPVVAIDQMPSPSFQGLACVVDGRPVIVLGHRYRSPGRVAFIVSHEVGHIAAGDCEAGQPVIDQDHDVSDDADIEQKADAFAARVMAGREAVPTLFASTASGLAQEALEFEAKTGVEASFMLFRRARTPADYRTAYQAAGLLEREIGATDELARAARANINMAGASETDRGLLRCIHGFAEFDEAPA